MQNMFALSELSLSPHQLYQKLWKMVEADDTEGVRQLVGTLNHVVRGNQTLASSAVMELIGVALRYQCKIEIKKILTQLPGFDAHGPFRFGGPTLINYVAQCGDTEFASYLLRTETPIQIPSSAGVVQYCLV